MSSARSRSAADRDFDATAESRFTPILCRFLLSIFYREVEVVGRENVPLEGPLVLVANHNNSLIDAALLAGCQPRMPRLLAASYLWDMAVLRPLLQLAAAVPVFRHRDPGADPKRNLEIFGRCHEVLQAGGAIGLCPEGTSHSHPYLLPLKTGVSRIVLEAEAKHPGLGTRIVAMGFTFDDKTRFRSRALVQIGEPVDPAPEVALYGENPRAAVRALTERVQDALAEVTLSFPSWDEARLIERAAEIFELPQPELPAEPPLSASFPLRKLFIEGYRSLKERAPEEVERVADAVRAYDEKLGFYRLSDRQVASRYPSAGVVRYTLESLLMLLVQLPLAAVGTALFFVPFQVSVEVAKRRPTEDVKATWAVLGWLIVMPLTWLLTVLLAGWLWGPLGGLATAVLAPVSGFVALRFHQRRGLFFRQARAFLLLRSGRSRVAELRRLRAEILEMMRELTERYRT